MPPWQVAFWRRTIAYGPQFAAGIPVLGTERSASRIRHAPQFQSLVQKALLNDTSRSTRADPRT